MDTNSLYSSSAVSPLVSALNSFSNISVSNVASEVERVASGWREESYSQRLPIWSKENGWVTLAKVFATNDLLNTPLSLQPVLDLSHTVMSQYSNSFDKENSDEINNSNILTKFTEAAAKLCKTIQASDRSPTDEENRFFHSLTEFLRLYLENVNSGDGFNIVVLIYAGALVTRHKIISLALMPMYDILYRSRMNQSKESFLSLTKLLNLLVKHAASDFVSVSLLPPNDDAKKEFPQKWMKATMDTINERRFSNDLKAHRFEHSQSQQDILSCSLMYGDDMRALYRKTRIFTVCIHSIKATELEAFDRNGLSDPYISFRMYESGEPEMKTKTIKKELNPEWIFEENDPKAKFNCVMKIPYKIGIYDWDMVGKNELMCEFTVDFYALRTMWKSAGAADSDKCTLVLKEPNKVKNGDMYKLGMHGELTIVMTFEPCIV
jgi:hypothetical protein